jgi:hypothetical protein
MFYEYNVGQELYLNKFMHNYRPQSGQIIAGELYRNDPETKKHRSVYFRRNWNCF